MADASDDHIELTVRRLLAQEELEIRKTLTSEIEGYRGFLQDQFKLLTWSLGVLLLAASGLLFFYFGKTKEDIENTMRMQIDEKVIEYQIVEAYKQKLREIIRAYSNGSEVRKSIDNTVKAAAGQHVRNSVDEILREKVAAEIRKTQASEVEAILNRALADIGDVEARITSLRVRLEAAEDRQQLTDINANAKLADLRMRFRNLEKMVQKINNDRSFNRVNGGSVGACGPGKTYDLGTGGCVDG